MFRSNRCPQASFLPNHTNQSSIDVGYGDHYGRSPTHVYNSKNRCRNPYSSNSNDSLLDMLQILSDRLKKSSAWLFFGMAFFALCTAYYRSQFNWMLDELQIDSISQIVTSYQHMQNTALWKEAPVDRVQRLEQDNMKLQKEKQQMKYYYENNAKKETNDRRAEERRLQFREAAWKSQVKVLQNATRRESRRSVIDKFGEGPHYVEFTFILPDDDDETERAFVVETAPLDLMPHAVHLFLQQVSHGLWDNAWFYLNGPHVLQAGPMLDEEQFEHLSDEEWDNLDERAAVLKPFKEKALDSLAFPEYSDQFPHAEWTLGFAGRPGGPDWYINKSDNTKSHGPGGQSQHDIEEEADSCFAKVISGFDQIELIFKEPTVKEGDEWQFFLDEPTYILEARIVAKPANGFNNNSNETHIIHDHSALHHHMHKSHINDIAP